MSDKVRNERVKTRIFHELKCQFDQDKVGMWRVTGESDGSGSYSNSTLGILSGKLSDCIDYALEMKSFFSYGTGGNLAVYNYPKVIKVDKDTIRRRTELEAQKAALKDNLKKIEDELRAL